MSIRFVTKGFVIREHLINNKNNFHMTDGINSGTVLAIKL